MFYGNHTDVIFICNAYRESGDSSKACAPSHKNIDLTVDIDYVGDLLQIKESIEQIIVAINMLLGGMTESMDVIRMGAVECIY